MSHFESNVLRHDRNQDVIGNWKINRLILSGNYNGLINGLNMQTDVLHYGNFQPAFVTGHKKIKSIEALSLNTRIINDIDIVDWYRNSVKLNALEDQVIKGHVTFKKFVHINDLKVHGLINGIDIRPENILMKSGEQVVNGDFIIDNMPNELTGFKPVFIQHLLLSNGNINGRNWNEFVENAFTKDSSFIDSNQIIFENELQMETVSADKNIYGVNMKEFLKESTTNKKLMKFKNNMEHLTKVGDDLMRSLSDNAVEMSHFEHHQSIPGKNVQNTVLFSFKNAFGNVEYILGIHEREDNEETIKFNRWDPQDTLFHSDALNITLSYKTEFYQLTQFHKIIYGGNDCLFLELIDKKSNNSYFQTILQYDSQAKTFKTIADMVSHESSMKIFTWRDGSMNCYGSIRNSFENVVIHCENHPQTVLKTRPIKVIWSENDIIVMANDEEKIQVWYEDKFYTVPAVINPVSFASCVFNDKLYLAVRSDKTDETVHRGDINIFVSSINDMRFEHLQKLTLNIPTAVQFSKAPSGDLFLYILTRDPTKALNIFSYAGSSNFVEVLSDSTIISEASDLDVIQINGKTEVLSIASSDNVYILQATLVEY